MKVVLRTIERTFTYDCQSSEISTLPHYNEAIYLDCSKGNLETLPSLPKNLQILECSHNSITNFPVLPDTLRTLYGSHNRVGTFPAVQQLQNLEIIDLSHNAMYFIKDVHLPSDLKELNLKSNVLTEFSVSTWPDGLVELDLSFNRLREISPTFDNLVQSCRVKLDNNDFPSQKYNAYTLWINLNNVNDVAKLVSRYTRFGISVKTRWESVMHAPVANRPVDNFVQDAMEPDAQNLMNQILNLDTRPVVRSVYQDAHNVHTSSIQDSTNNSIKWLLSSGPIEHNATSNIKRLWRPSQWWNVVQWMDVLHANTLLDEWCE